MSRDRIILGIIDIFLLQATAAVVYVLFQDSWQRRKNVAKAEVRCVTAAVWLVLVLGAVAEIALGVML